MFIYRLYVPKSHKNYTQYIQSSWSKTRRSFCVPFFIINLPSDYNLCCTWAFLSLSTSVSCKRKRKGKHAHFLSPTFSFSSTFFLQVTITNLLTTFSLLLRPFPHIILLFHWSRKYVYGHHHRHPVIFLHPVFPSPCVYLQGYLCTFQNRYDPSACVLTAHQHNGATARKRRRPLFSPFHNRKFFLPKNLSYSTTLSSSQSACYPPRVFLPAGKKIVRVSYINFGASYLHCMRKKLHKTVGTRNLIASFLSVVCMCAGFFLQ